MERMVINFMPDGSIQHTLKDGFLNPAPEQYREIERMSSIKFNGFKQKFYIVWNKGPLTGKFERIEGLTGANSVMLFDTYEQAVEHEIKRANEMRLNGAVF